MSIWNDNRVQFPRLLSEIIATQENLNLYAIAEAMDVQLSDIHDVFDRAHIAWEQAKLNQKFHEENSHS